MSKIDFYQVAKPNGSLISINIQNVDTITEDGEGIVTLTFGETRLRVTAESFAAVIRHADVGYYRLEQKASEEKETETPAE